MNLRDDPNPSSASKSGAAAAELEPAEVREQLDRILCAGEFTRSKRIADFLRFVVVETLEGRGDRIKQYTIATKVFERERDFDQHNDPIVRVQAAKVRRALQRYYYEEGGSDGVEIQIPKGTYVPRFSRRRVDVPAEPPAVPRDVRPPTIAVMPFANQSGDASKDFLATGFAEDLSTELSRFAGVSVIAFYTTQRYASGTQDVSQIGRELGADYLVTGSVRQADTELRINIQVVCTEDGRQLWGERFHQALSTSSLNQVQDDIIQLVLARIAGRYGAIHESTSRASRRVTHASLSGYEAVLRSLYYDKTMAPSDFTDALTALESAVVAEPNSPIVAARLAILYLDSHAFGLDVVQEGFSKGVRLAERAVALDPNSQDALYAFAWASLLRRDRDGTRDAARKLVDLTPGEAYLVGTGGWFLAMAGQLEEGQAIIEKSQRLNPRCPNWFHLIPFLMHFEKGEYEPALSEANALGIPDLFWDPLIKAATLGHLGRVEQARKSIDALITLRPDFVENASHYIGMFILSDSIRERLHDGLRAAGLDATQTAC